MSIVRDETRSEEIKVRDLKSIQGSLTEEEARTVGGLLGQTSGELMLAVGEAMVRCGAARFGLATMEKIAGERERPVSQFAPALAFLDKNSFEIRDAKGNRFFDAAVMALFNRLKSPKDQTELVDILRARAFLCRPGSWSMTGEDPIVGQLCVLLKHPSAEVREEAARDLAGTPSQQFVPGSAIVPLIAVLRETDAETARAINRLLKVVLRTGPETEEASGVTAFWGAWAEKAGENFELAHYALRKADSAGDLSLWDKQFLGWQVLYASRELPLAEREKAWRHLRKFFRNDPSPAGRRAIAWLRSLTEMAEREKGSQIREEALSLLMDLTQSDELQFRVWSLSLLGEMEASMALGSRPRLLLERTLEDAKAAPDERAMAAWSLRKALKEEPGLADRMVKVGEYLKTCPKNSFKSREQGVCIAHISDALSEAFNVKLGLDPSQWEAVLKGVPR